MSESQPTFDAYIEPLLEVLAEKPDGVTTSEAYELLADRMGLSRAQRDELLPSGRQPIYQNRIGWAHDRLKRAGLSHSKKRGTWALTDEGREFAERFQDNLDQYLVAISRPRDYDFDVDKVLGREDDQWENSVDSDTHERTPGTSESFTAMEAAKIVLADADDPLHYREITRRILDRGLWQTEGKTPAESVGAGLSVDIKKHGDASDFVRTSPGLYTLNRNGLETTSEPETPPKESPSKSSPSYDPISFTDAAERVLQVFANHEPMHYTEITDRALDLRLIVTESDVPSSSMYSSITQETKRRKERGDTPRFELHGNGMVGLTRWHQTGLTAYIEAHNDKIRRRFHEHLHETDPTEFEELIGQLLISLGFEEVDVTSRHNDGGIDVRGTLVVGDVIRTRMAVQVKRWKNNVQTPEVQKVRGSLGSHEQGLIITTSDFSSGARDEAERADAVPVGLMDGEQLVRLLVEHGLGVKKDELNLLRMG